MERVWERAKECERMGERAMERERMRERTMGPWVSEGANEEARQRAN